MTIPLFTEEQECPPFLGQALMNFLKEALFNKERAYLALSASMV